MTSDTSWNLGNRGVWLALLGAIFVPSAVAGPIIDSYSGSFSLVSISPISDPEVSIRLTVGSLFTDCSVPGACAQLVLWNGLVAANSGQSDAAANIGAVETALTGGALDVFWFETNFGSTYSAASAGSIGVFTSGLAASYTGAPIGSLWLTIRSLNFQAINGPSGAGTQATIQYTLDLRGPDVPAMSNSSAAGPSYPPQNGQNLGTGAGTASGPQTGVSENLLYAPTAPAPEPATWWMAALGAGLIALSRSRR